MDERADRLLVETFPVGGTNSGESRGKRRCFWCKDPYQPGWLVCYRAAGLVLPLPLCLDNGEPRRKTGCDFPRQEIGPFRWRNGPTAWFGEAESQSYGEHLAAVGQNVLGHAGRDRQDWPVG